MTAMSPKRLELMRHLRREGPMSIRRLAQQLGCDYKSVHSETSLLIQTGLIARTAEGEVRIGSLPNWIWRRDLYCGLELSYDAVNVRT